MDQLDLGLGSFLSNQDERDKKEERQNGLTTPPGETMDPVATLDFERKRLEDL